jgi:peptidoglycan/xylan/chitin deacetylase (PgdA/CDA1 family)
MNFKCGGVLLACAAMVTGAIAEPGQPRASGPFRVAFTFDDLPLGARQTDLETTRSINQSILNVLGKHQIQAVGFVNEKKLYQPGEIDERIAILKLWTDSRQELGNHTFSHPSLQVTPLEEFKADVIRGEIITRMLLKEAGKEIRYFRHPFLRTGPSKAVREKFESFLHRKNYTIAPVTIENWDWLFAQVYRNAVENGDEALAEKTSLAFLEYTFDQIDYCERASITILGKQVSHILLLHANALVAETLDELLRRLRGRNYRFVSLGKALEDPAYGRPDNYIGKAGVSWLFRWDHSAGRQVDWTREPEPPEWVRTAYSGRTAPPPITP